MDFRRILIFAVSAALFAGCTSDKVALVAHRGYWNCEEAIFSENSIASLQKAQQEGLWGSEFDVQLTADSVVIVNHDNNILTPDSTLLKISEHNFAEFDKCLLPNGERRPTLDEYLAQGAQCPSTKLIMELKVQESPEREDLLLDKAFEALKRNGVFDPQRVIFISFSRHITERIAEEAPDFINQYLNGELSPEELSERNINGMDYRYNVYREHPDWLPKALEKGISTNVWTVNDEELASEMIDCGVKAITTNEPLLLRKLLGSRELRGKSCR